MNSLTATALEWHNQGQDDKRVLDNTVSDLVDRVIDDYDLNIEPNEYEQVVLDQWLIQLIKWLKLPNEMAIWKNTRPIWLSMRN